jgi:hypothetical protein
MLHVPATKPDRRCVPEQKTAANSFAIAHGKLANKLRVGLIVAAKC